MKESVQLDPLDRRILAAVQVDGSISQSDLAQKVGASAASCWRRLKSLREAGVLGPVVQLVNARRLGRGLDVLCQIRMKSHTLADRSAFETFVAGRPEVMECYSTSGEWDYQLRVVVADVEAYNVFLMQTLLNEGSVAACASHFALARIKYTTAIPV